MSDPWREEPSPDKKNEFFVAGKQLNGERCIIARMPTPVPSQCSNARFGRPPKSMETQDPPGSGGRVLITQVSDDEGDEGEIGQTEDEGEKYDNGVPECKPHTQVDTCTDDPTDADTDNDLESELEFYCVDIDDEENYDTDLEMDGEEWLRGSFDDDTTGVKEYIRECNRCGVIPISYFQRHIQDHEFVMRYHGLGPLGAKAIAKPLEHNTCVQKLDLDGNNVDAEGAVYLSKMLADNLYITDLVLSNNNLRSVGCKALCEALCENSSLLGLDLSGNGFRDCDGEYFCKLLQANSNLRKLILRHNKFEVDAARWLRDALIQNENLKVLDLSWNHFRMKGGQYLAEIIKENYGLKYLSISMNGLGHLGANYIGDALKHNQCLTELNVSGNRIPAHGAEQIAKGLMVNDVLETLKIGQNPIANKGALALLSSMQKNMQNTAMYMLDMSGVIVDEEFDKLEKSMKGERGFQVIHGGVLFRHKHVIVPESEDLEAKFERDPMTKLKRFADIHKLRLVDLFKQFDKDGSWSVSHQEFRKGIQSTGIDLSVDEMEMLLNRLDADGDGEIDYGELALGDKEHRAKRRRMKEWRKEMDENGVDRTKSPEPVIIVI